LICNLVFLVTKYLVDILSPLLTFEFFVRNARDFVKFVNGFQCFDDECLVSFDVVSLFTSILIPEVLVIISDLLFSDNLLHERTKLTVNDVLSSLELSLHSTIFAFNNTLYRQIFGSRVRS